jgi:hypothetical protein
MKTISLLAIGLASAMAASVATASYAKSSSHHIQHHRAQATSEQERGQARESSGQCWHEGTAGMSPNGMYLTYPVPCSAQGARSYRR